MARKVNKIQLLENLMDRCIKRSFIDNESLDIWGQMMKLKTIQNESEEIQEAINYYIARAIFDVNYTKEEEKEFMKLLVQHGYIEADLKHKYINLSEMKEDFPNEKITKSRLQEWARLQHDIVLNGIVCRASQWGKTLQVSYVKDGHIKHYSAAITE